MHFLLGNSHVEDGDYERAIESFKLARDKLGDHKEGPPSIISLVYSLLSGFIGIDPEF